jgi:hypothetical protein
LAAFGNGEPGGDFHFRFNYLHFRFNYLPGDVNHDAITNPGDWLAIRNLGFVQISHLAEPSVPGSSSGSGAELSWDEPFWGTGGAH